MARRIAVFQTDQDSDFAMLSASQHFIDEADQGGVYAISTPGGILMTAGTKYPKVTMTLERWDSRPPDVSTHWEDVDELPWQSVPGAGPVGVGGFDAPEPGVGLDLDGLERGRVQVLARGRHRYGYGDGDWTDDLPREEWLLRFWPDAGHLSALAGPPRRLAGPPLGYSSRSAWQAALHGWTQTGWDQIFLGLRAFEELRNTLYRRGQPSTAEELLDTAREFSYPLDPTLSWQTPAVRDLEHTEFWLIRLAAAAALPAVHTFGDALLCLQRLGLVAEWASPTDTRLVPNPAPVPVWDVVEMNSDYQTAVQVQALRRDFAGWQADLHHVMRWSDGPLAVTPRQLAIRLATDVDDILGTLKLMQLDEMLSHGAEGDLTADTVLSLQRGPRDSSGHYRSQPPA